MKTIWQYDMIVCPDNLELCKALNKKGEQGWEAYSVLRIEYKHGKVYTAYLKRLKPDRNANTP